MIRQVDAPPRLELDGLDTRLAAADEHDRGDRGHPDREAQEQARAAGEAGRHELDLAAEGEVDLDHVLRQDGDERDARHRDPRRDVDLGGLGGRGEHEGRGHHRAAEDDHGERRRKVDPAQPHQHPGQRARRHHRQPALPDRQRGQRGSVPPTVGRWRCARPPRPGPGARPPRSATRAPARSPGWSETGRQTGMAAQAGCRSEIRTTTIRRRRRPAARTRVSAPAVPRSARRPLGRARAVSAISALARSSRLGRSPWPLLAPWPVLPSGPPVPGLVEPVDQRRPSILVVGGLLRSGPPPARGRLLAGPRPRAASPARRPG